MPIPIAAPVGMPDFPPTLLLLPGVLVDCIVVDNLDDEDVVVAVLPGILEDYDCKYYRTIEHGNYDSQR